MRSLLLFTLVFVTSIAYCQEAATISPDSVLTTLDWLETSGGEREGYVLTMTDDGNFEEDAGEQHNRPYRYLMGRWKIGAAAQTLTLSVDGQMGKTGVHRRYLKGRDFYLVYDLILLENGTLALKDHLTGAKRTFKAIERKEYVEPAMRRIPKPGKKNGGLKLPGGWGGLGK
jgi:hypothetical protein